MVLLELQFITAAGDQTWVNLSWSDQMVFFRVHRCNFPVRLSTSLGKAEIAATVASRSGLVPLACLSLSVSDWLVTMSSYGGIAHRRRPV
jgi:hypothetical protein